MASTEPTRLNIGIYIYDDAEVLDFAGPFEVFSTANRLGNNNWHVFFVAEKPSVVRARSDFLITPHFTIDEHPDIDVLLVAGGIHTKEVEKPNVITWVSNVAESAKTVASVCTGSFILAEAGLLDGLDATTHWEDIPDLKSDYPKLNVIDNRRWISEGKFVTSGGISAGIDMSLFLVSELASPTLSANTAKQMEYEWRHCT